MTRRASPSRASTPARELSREMVDRDRARAPDALSASTAPVSVENARAMGDAVRAERESRHVVRDATDRRVVVTRSDVDAKRAIHIVDCARCVVEMDASVTCAKVFVERCVECVVVSAGRVVSEHAEIWDCEGCVVTFKRGLGTIQIDQCREVRLEYERKGFMGAVVFATSVGVRVAFADDGDGGERRRLDTEDLAPGDHREIPQFIARFVNGELLVERLIRGKDEYPTTERELRESLGDALAREHLDTAPARAELRKDKGNAAFKEGNYAQAVVHYTEALELDPSHVVALCNRAQCLLKLGEHEKALADADAAVDVKSDYVKAHFRRGLALHALKRFQEAVRAFEDTLRIDPKNIQAKDSLRVAEYAAGRAARES